jgi:hypothetical protein
MAREIEMTGEDLRSKRTKDLLELKLILNYIGKTKETSELMELIDKTIKGRNERKEYDGITGKCFKTVLNSYDWKTEMFTKVIGVKRETSLLITTVTIERGIRQAIPIPENSMVVHVRESYISDNFYSTKNGKTYTLCHRRGTPVEISEEEFTEAYNAVKHINDCYGNK